MRRLLAAALATFLVTAAAANEGAPAEIMAEASRRVAEASAALQAARSRTNRIAALGVAIAAYEGALAMLRSGVRAAGGQERAILLELAGRREEIAALLAALQKMSRTPPPVQAMHPQGPLGAARAAAMTRRLAPRLQQEAEELASILREIADARKLRQQGEAELEAGLAVISEARTELRRALDAEMPPAAIDGGDPMIATMLRGSDTLTALAEALSRVDGDDAETGRQPLVWPVANAVLSRGFNAPDAAGVRRPGILMQAPPLSMVTAPADGIVRYAGPFLDYGYVVVLEIDSGALVVLAGLAQLQIATGEPVSTGDLLGLLGGRPLGVEEYLMLPEAGTGTGIGETVYIEIRNGEGSVDPVPWFASENG